MGCDDIIATLGYCIGSEEHEEFFAPRRKVMKFFSLVVFFLSLRSILRPLSIITFETRMDNNNQLTNTRNSPLTPANMRRVGGGYVALQGRTTRTQTCSKNKTEKNELARLRQENVLLKKEILSLKTARLQSESALASQTQTLQIMANTSSKLQSQLTKVEGEAAQQKAYVEQLLCELETAASEHNVSKKLLEKAQAELKEAVALTTNYRTQLTKLSNDHKMAQLQREALPPMQPPRSRSQNFFKKPDGDDAASFLKNMNKALQNENKGLQSKIVELRVIIEQLQRKVRQIHFTKQHTRNVGSRNTYFLFNISLFSLNCFVRFPLICILWLHDLCIKLNSGQVFFLVHSLYARRSSKGFDPCGMYNLSVEGISIPIVRTRLNLFVMPTENFASKRYGLNTGVSVPNNPSDRSGETTSCKINGMILRKYFVSLLLNRRTV